MVFDLDRFVSLESFWDREFCDRVDDPFLSGYLLALHWKLGQQVGFLPFMMVFLVGGKIVGFVPLMMRSRFFNKSVSTFDQYMCPDFIVDKYREVCIGLMVDFLFGRLNCESADLTFMDGSAK